MPESSADRPPFRSRPLRAFPFFVPRRRGALLGVLALGSILATRVAFLSTVRHDAYESEVERNPISTRRLPAPRGTIFDAEGVLLTANERCYALVYTSRQKLAEPTDLDVDQILLPVASLPHFEGLLTADFRARMRRNLDGKLQLRLLSGLPQSAVIPILERPESFPNLSVTPDFRRTYPAGAPCGLLTGFIGPIPTEAAFQYPAERYRPDDEVGRAGLEAQFESELAGTPGTEERRQDARGRPLAPPTILRPTVPGADIYTTVRVGWQDKAYRLLQNRKGSVVVAELPSGAVRVLASYPSFDPNRPGDELGPDGLPTSHFNRTVRGLYPPGSTFKPFVILGAVRGGWDLSRTMTCTGSVTVPGWSRPFHCNVRTGHGPMNTTRALAESCNAFFYQIAADRGVADFMELAGEYGFGATTGLELRGEAAGQTSRQGRLDAGEELNLSIGQGSMLATVAQVARAYAGIALGEEAPPLHLVERLVDADGTERPIERAVDALHPSVSPEARRVVIEGMARAVSDPKGTAYKAGFDPAWQVCGKTGTAENATGGQDAWFAGFYPRSAPRYVIVVHIEESVGHGGDEAAPVAADLIRFMESPEDTEDAGTGEP